MRISGLVIVAILMSVPAYANNARCWGGVDDKGRPDVTCTSLTEQLLLGLRNANRQQVIKAMDADGRPIEGGIHYLSNAKTYSGDVNLLFEDGRVLVIYALVQPTDGSKNLEFIWNAERPGCSDFRESRKRCNDN